MARSSSLRSTSSRTRFVAAALLLFAAPSCRDDAAASPGDASVGAPDDAGPDAASEATGALASGDGSLAGDANGATDAGTAAGDATVAADASTDALPTQLGGPGLLVLFGGAVEGFHTLYFNDTWTFDGATWSQVPVASSPPARSEASMATLGAGVVLFGGSDTDIFGTPMNDTWTFDGAAWTRVNVSTSPPARYAAGMATLGAQVVLFGGQEQWTGTYQELGDTWTFDGKTWKEVSSPNAPPARFNPGMATLGDRVVLYGGMYETAGTVQYLYDTWSFDGSSWTQLGSSNPGAGANTNAGLASLGSQVVLFADDERTWTFGGTTWSQTNAPAPFLPLADQGRKGFSLAALHDRVVFFGGYPVGAGVALDDTWTFDGSQWAFVSVCHAPPARESASLAFLPGPSTGGGPIDAGECDADTIPDACDAATICVGFCGMLRTAHCGIVPCGGCGPGTSCGGGGVANVCGSGACSTTSCPGCCAGGQCLPGTEKGACGSGGEACFSCGDVVCAGSSCGCGTGTAYNDAGQAVGSACTTSADCAGCISPVGQGSFCCSGVCVAGFGSPCNP